MSKTTLYSNQYSICRTVVQCLTPLLIFFFVVVMQRERRKKKKWKIYVKTYAVICNAPHQHIVEMWFSNDIQGISILIEWHRYRQTVRHQVEMMFAKKKVSKLNIYLTFTYAYHNQFLMRNYSWKIKHPKRRHKEWFIGVCLGC